MKKLNEIKKAITTTRTGKVSPQIGMMIPSITKSSEIDAFGPTGYTNSVECITGIQIELQYSAPSDKLHIARNHANKTVMKYLYGDITSELIDIYHGMQMQDEFRSSDEVERIGVLLEKLTAVQE